MAFEIAKNPAMMERSHLKESDMSETRSALREAAVEAVESAVLARLIAEVSTPGLAMNATCYNRTHNRHNR